MPTRQNPECDSRTVTRSDHGASRLLPIDAVLDRLCVCRTVLYAWIAAGTFPAPIKLGRSSRWLASAVDDFVTSVAEAGALSPVQGDATSYAGIWVTRRSGGVV